MRSLISHGPRTTWSTGVVPLATTNGGRRGAKAPPPRWGCVARSSCSPPLPLGYASLRPGSWRPRTSGPGNLSVMTWTHTATGAPSSDAFAAILRHILQSLRLPYSSSVCHPRKKRAALIRDNTPLTHAALHDVEVVISRVDEAEVDEMWAFVGKKQTHGGCGMRSVRRESGMEECHKTLGYTGTL